MKIFISWSGEQSKYIAQKLRGWLPLVIQSIEPWMSKEDIQAGQRWSPAIAAELEQTDFGIICLTPDNLEAPWLMFEAGALAKSTEAARVIPLLFNMEVSAVKQPLSQFQAQKLNKDGLKEILSAINATIPRPLGSGQLDRTLDAHWGEFEKDLRSVPPTIAPPPTPSDPAKVLEELVVLVRGLATTSGEEIRAGFAHLLKQIETRDPRSVRSSPENQESKEHNSFIIRPLLVALDKGTSLSTAHKIREHLRYVLGDLVGSVFQGEGDHSDFVSIEVYGNNATYKRAVREVEEFKKSNQL